ncbi:MAG: ATP-dependent Clp protease proteolytic subunit [Clostridia bacterium]|nr:ATP-dependent Clp protease proteolytic subunit [Clostridia bacterium]
MDNEKIVGTLVPYVVDQTKNGERSYDIFSRMLEDRIVFLSGPIDNAMASLVVAQLIYLEGKDSEKDIFLYINSPGGSVVDGLAIYDTMNYIKCDVNTICIGEAMSMGALLLSAGAKGKRFALPNAEIMIHQVLVSGGIGGQATDVEIYTKHLMRSKKRLNEILSECSGQPYEKVCEDTERDNFMTAEEALEYGLIDKIYKNRQPSEA